MRPLLVCSECGVRPESCPCPASIREYPLVTLDAYRRKQDEQRGPLAKAARWVL